MNSPQPVIEPPAIRGVPIFIYQMGKVGSQTIEASLKQLDLPDSIHPIHVLSPAKIKCAVKRNEKAGKKNERHLQNSFLVRDFLDTQLAPSINVITAVRDPVAQLVSAIFQNMDLLPQFIDESGIWDENAIEEFVHLRIEQYDTENEWNCSWFDSEFQPALGVNVYDVPFDHDSGFVTIEQENTRVLILRLENVNNWGSVISKFLHLESEISLEKNPQVTRCTTPPTRK